FFSTECGVCMCVFTHPGGLAMAIDKVHTNAQQRIEAHDPAAYGSHQWQDEIIRQTWNDPKALAKVLDQCAVRNNSPQGASELLRAADAQHGDSAKWIDQMHAASSAVDGSLWETLAIGHVKKTGLLDHPDNLALLHHTVLEASQLDTIGRDPQMH